MPRNDIQGVRAAGESVDSADRKKQDDRLDRLLIKARKRLTRLQPRAVVDAVRNGAMVVDIRPEFQRRNDGEIPGALIVERNHLEWRLHPGSSGRIEEADRPDVQWIVICDEGYASSLAAAVLRLVGLRRATDVVGGFQAWRAAGMPVNPPGGLTAPRLAPRQLDEQ